MIDGPADVTMGLSCLPGEFEEKIRSIDSEVASLLGNDRFIWGWAGGENVGLYSRSKGLLLQVPRDEFSGISSAQVIERVEEAVA